MAKLFLAAAAASVALFIFAITGVGISLALENQDIFCAACHTEPESTYYNQSTQTNPTTLAAFHTHKQTACIDCHSGSGAFGRIQGMEQGAHDFATFMSGAYHHPAVTTNPLSDASCLKCHQNVVQRARGGGDENEGRNGHYHFFLARWQASDPKAARCITCHTAHTAGAGNSQFINQSQVAKECSNCHAKLRGGED